MARLTILKSNMKHEISVFVRALRGKYYSLIVGGGNTFLNVMVTYHNSHIVLFRLTAKARTYYSPANVPSFRFH